MSFPRNIEKAVFDAAAAIESAELRGRFLDEVCRGDEARRQRLGRLLEAREPAEDFFLEAEDARRRVAAEACEEIPPQEPPAPAEDETEGPGSRIGRYRIERVIGKGGCGVVYLAEQLEPVRRQVALKVIRRGLDNAAVIARFQMERQALALMDHPNIAHVLDAGAMADGRPFFVMEWVKGERITEFCDVRRLTVRERLDLFIEVCQAIQHAHQKGVIHRDIKPSNILVGLQEGRHQVKVIDFGIATPRERGAWDGVGEVLVGTPAYMSPEMADRRCADVDTRTDVYSLGVVLHELLTGHTPQDREALAAAGVAGLPKLLAETGNTAPSARLAGLPMAERERVAAARRCSPRQLMRILGGDLDAVLMKAMAADRRQRFDAVSGLAMDIRRVLAQEPVVARPQRRVDVIGKFVRRNRLACGATAAIAASLVAGAWLAYASMLREREARQEQARLREVAEQARRRESHLRQMAAVRENISQVAFLVSEGKTEEADAMLRETPLDEVEPSVEATVALRSLGSWNAMRGRWPQAAECYMLLTQTARHQAPDQLITHRDLVSAGPVLAEKGERETFERFRSWALDRFAESGDALACQQVIQATLLLPASPEFLERLHHHRTLLEDSEFDPARLSAGWYTEFAGWKAWSLAMIALRQGDHPAALEWGTRVLELRNDKLALEAVARPVLALAHHAMGEPEAAARELHETAMLLQQAFKPDMVPAYEPAGTGKGFWWDWLQARLLFREAERRILYIPGAG